MVKQCVYSGCEEVRVTAFVCSKHLFETPKINKKVLSADALRATKPFNHTKWRRDAKLNHKRIIDKHS